MLFMYTYLRSSNKVPPVSRESLLHHRNRYLLQVGFGNEKFHNTKKDVIIITLRTIPAQRAEVECL